MDITTNLVNWRQAGLAACFVAAATSVNSAQSLQSKPAEPHVGAANHAVRAELPFADRQDFEDAMRGFVATTPDPDNPERYAFLEQEAPPTVNPSLWRQSQLNAIHGLFKVADGVYQIRGFAPSSMTIVEGRTGIIVMDTLTTPGAAREALALYFAHRARKPVVAVIYTHGHGDHYGGASGVISQGDVAAGKTKVIAPMGFMESVVAESAAGGNAKNRRAQYQFGISLPIGDRGNVDEGTGKGGARGASGPGALIAPTEIIQQPAAIRTIDGVTFTFQLALESEAPAAMLIYLPQSRVLNVAELASHTLHNLLPFRGAVVRDANRWSQYLDAALEQFGDEAQVLIDQHTWPVWGGARVRERLASQRDLYKYIHDQTLRMINQGLGPTEIAEALTMPPGLENEWSARGYYGTLSHNAKAVYQRYLGWYDGNPATLNRLTRIEEARQYLEYMGGPAAVIARARDDFKAGRYRWVAHVTNQLVFADPSNKDARALAADAFEQLGYLAESATWRNAYLLGAQELRGGVRAAARPVPGISPAMLRAMPIGQVFDYLGTRVDGPRAGTSSLVINWRFTDSGESLVSTLQHGALTWRSGKTAPSAVATVSTTRPAFESVVLGLRTLADAIGQREIATTGDAGAVASLFALFVGFDPGFPLVEPRPVPPPSTSAEVKHYPLETTAGLLLQNVAAEPVVLQGKKGLRITFSGSTDQFKGLMREELAKAQARIPHYAVIDGLEFGNGVIEAEIAGAPEPGAAATARGFVGIAFRLQNGAYDAFYLRPINGRAEDQEQRNHATQYVAHPDWTWFRLRTETPSRYESYVDLLPDVWTKVRIEVRDQTARLFVHDQEQPTLVVNDLKSGAHGRGAVALWIDVGTAAHFRNLTVR
jgi:alkyl sulfatase BDS1-like metallo-beta-lactamase superfamily hydrolase